MWIEVEVKAVEDNGVVQALSVWTLLDATPIDLFRVQGAIETRRLTEDKILSLNVCRVCGGTCGGNNDPCSECNGAGYYERET